MKARYLVSKITRASSAIALAWLFSACGPSTLSQLRNEMVSLNAQGRYPEAKEAAYRALKTSEQNFGPEDPQVAIDLHNIATFARREAVFSKDEETRKRATAEAVQSYKRALAIRERTIGLRNSLTLDTMISLADAYSFGRRYDEAEGFYKRALETLKELGPRAPVLQHLEQRATGGLSQIEKARKK